MPVIVAFRASGYTWGASAEHLNDRPYVGTYMTVLISAAIIINDCVCAKTVEICAGYAMGIAEVGDCHIRESNSGSTL